jgi:hypothetical protein
VRARTRRGETIAIAAPFPRWEQGYEYVYARAIYPLAGRWVVPLMDEESRSRLDNLARADVIAAYRVAPQIPGFREEWRGAGGVQLRRVR